jgi:hypothetical protein
VPARLPNGRRAFFYPLPGKACRRAPRNHLDLLCPPGCRTVAGRFSIRCQGKHAGELAANLTEADVGAVAVYRFVNFTI